MSPYCNSIPVCQRTHSALTSSNLATRASLEMDGDTQKKDRTMSTIASSARTLVMSRDQKPLGKYDMSSRRLMQRSGSKRRLSSQCDGERGIASTPGSTPDSDPEKRVILIKSFTEDYLQDFTAIIRFFLSKKAFYNLDKKV